MKRVADSMVSKTGSPGFQMCHVRGLDVWADGTGAHFDSVSMGETLVCWCVHVCVCVCVCVCVFLFGMVLCCLFCFVCACVLFASAGLCHVQKDQLHFGLNLYRLSQAVSHVE